MRAKRAIDIVIGSACALAALPFIAVLAVGCAVALGAWPFFVQRRVGKDGKEFPLPKLRTLPPSAPCAATKYELAGTPIPKFCRFLRRTHIDELPQLLVVPLGWMSLVGPRPELPNLLAAYPEEFVAQRLGLRPGCTGLWQVSNSSGKLICEAPEYDLAYVQRGGMRLDVWILYRTVRMGITGRCEIELTDVPDWVWNRRAASGPCSPETNYVDLVAAEEIEARQQREADQLSLLPLEVDDELVNP